MRSYAASAGQCRIGGRYSSLRLYGIIRKDYHDSSELICFDLLDHVIVGDSKSGPLGLGTHSFYSARLL